jgi:metal-responsive CopG/Arc/MetJ family transcriptional regulator
MYMQVQTFNISLPKELVRKADLVAKKEYRNRSELIKEALRSYLQNREAWSQIFAAGARAARKLGIKSEKEVYKIVEEYRHGDKSS